MAITSILRVLKLAALSMVSPYMVIYKDKVVFRLPLDFMPKVVSAFHINEEIVVPSFCPNPVHPMEQNWHLLDVVRAVKFCIHRIQEFRKSDAFLPGSRW